MSFRIMKTNEYGDATFYRASCHCTDPECDIALELEIVPDFDHINLNFYEDMIYASYWNSSNWFSDKWIRIKGAVRLLLTGKIKLENSFVFEGQQHIEAFLEALTDGLKELVDKKKVENWKKETE